MSLVEEALRAQRQYWREISDRVSRIPHHELSPESPKRVIFFGVGSSHHAARLCAFAYLRDKSRARVPVLACSSLAIGVEVFPNKGDWVFGISHRGKTRATLAALEFSERSGAYTIAVCANEVVDVPSARFMLSTTPLEKCEPHTASLTGAICAITSLLMGTRATEEWDALASMGNPDLNQLREKAVKGPTIILGEWEGEWVAREAALKLNEMARMTPRTYSSEEFFHGPHWARKKGDTIWQIVTSKDSRSEEIKADYSVGIFGSSPLAAIPALVEAQWLALATAQNLDINPDGATG